MKISLVFIMSVIYIINAKHLGKTSEGLQIFKIDLNEEPQERFKETVNYFKKEILDLVDIYRTMIDFSVNFMFKSLELVSLDLNSDRYKEMEGISEELDL